MNSTLFVGLQLIMEFNSTFNSVLVPLVQLELVINTLK